MEMEQRMACLLAEIRTNQTKMDAYLKETKEELTARLEAKIEVELRTTIEKFEVLRSTLVSWTDIHQAGQRSLKKK
jgi:hypothetical protein